MTIRKTMLKITAVSAVVLSLGSCDHDTETIGSEIIGEPGFEALLYDQAEINTRTVNLEGVQTNNLPVHQLGVYEHGFYGTQQAHLLTQLSLPGANPNFGNNPTLDSVVLSIPYFHTQGETDAQGRTSYELDSIYGNSPISLSIEESGIFLNNYDPETNFETAQKYYSNMQEQVESNLTGNVLYQTDQFVPSSAEVVNFEGNGTGEIDTLNLAPQLRVHLPVEFFQERILNREGDAVLSSNNNFQNYLRGLYIKAEPFNNGGSLMMLNLRSENAGVSLYYTTESEDGEEIGHTYQLGFGPTQVNLFEQAIAAQTDENLYLRGGHGSVALVELFSGTDSDGNGVSDELEDLRANNWLVNEANLIFHVNREAMQGTEEPERVYLYNLDEGSLLADYVLDGQNGANSMNSVSNEGHLVPLERDADGNGLRYKIRITGHIHNILNNGADNVRLGLAVSQNVNVISNSAARTAGEVNVERVPVSSVISPEGTVLYGDAAGEDKRPQLNIYYTESKN